MPAIADVRNAAAVCLSRERREEDSDADCRRRCEEQMAVGVVL